MFFRRRPEEVSTKEIYEFIRENDKKYRVNLMCSILKVSESGYYKHLKSLNKPDKDEFLLVEIKKIIDEAPENENYGRERIRIALEQKGIYVSVGKIRRVMKKYNLTVKIKHYPNGLTKADKNAQKSENLIQRDFTAEHPMEKLLTDITEVSCSDGKLYIAAILDCFNGEIVGLAMDNNMRKELCISALESAFKGKKSTILNAILHSDRGSQFTSQAYRDKLSEYNLIQSMSGTGRCYDNARMESFFATLKKEKLYKINTAKLPMDTVKSIVFRYIMVYYNRQRICTVNPGGYPPAIYRQIFESALKSVA